MKNKRRDVKKVDYKTLIKNDPLTKLPSFNQLLLDYKKMRSKKKHAYITVFYILPSIKQSVNNPFLNNDKELVALIKKLSVDIKYKMKKVSKYETDVYYFDGLLVCICDEQKKLDLIVKWITKNLITNSNYKSYLASSEIQKKTGKPLKCLVLSINSCINKINELEVQNENEEK